LRVYHFKYQGLRELWMRKNFGAILDIRPFAEGPSQNVKTSLKNHFSPEGAPAEANKKSDREKSQSLRHCW
ncbi:MAG: hypothetical protein ACI3Z0_03420, partial [Candidatus Cryptobacteroides sp.]